MAASRLDRSVRWLAGRRAWVQGLFLVVWLDPLMLRLHNVCGPVFHCYSCPLAAFACPIGVLANFSALHLFPFAAVGTLVVIGAGIGNALCGWACPFGFLQDAAGWIPTPRFRLPAWTGYARYLVLVSLVVVVPYLWSESHSLFFCRLCPAGALEGALPNTVNVARAGGGIVLPNAAKLIVLGVVLVAMLFTLRPWCKVLCPLGAVFGLFNQASMVTLRFRSNTCQGCGQCDKMCRYGVLPNRNVNNSRCIRCLECTKCGALAVGTVFTGSAEADETTLGPAVKLRG
ncbi:MAG: 4Fe-4S binding protein [Planctomycetes bacterium]|nr:4Fe-4S binding protein [Planctomycetota bacterium]